MSTQPEALRLADAMDAVNKNNADSLLVQMAARSAAAELRRLYWDELRVREHRDEMCAEVTRLHAEIERLRPGDVLYTQPAPSVPADVARDAERYRWLRRKACVIGKTTYCGEETGQPILDFVNLPDVTEVIRRDSASTLDAAIDAAMLAAQAQKG